MIAMHEADEDLGDHGRADGTQRHAALADLRLLQNVVPEGSANMQAMLLRHGAVRSTRYLVRRQRIGDPHGLRDILPRRQAEHDAAPKVTKRQAAAATRQGMQFGNDERIDLARLVQRHPGRVGAKVEVAPPIDDPVARQPGPGQGLSRFDGQDSSPTAWPRASPTPALTISFRPHWTRTSWRPTAAESTVHPPIRHRVTGRPTVGQQRRLDQRFSFTAFPVGDDPQTNRVNVLYEDRRGRLWAGTDGGLFSLDPSTAFGRVKLDMPSRPDRAVQIWALAEDHEGTLWMGTSWGLVRRSPDGRTLQIAVQPAQGADHVRALLFDRDQRIWIGHDTGLIVYRPGRTERTSRISFACRGSHDPGAR